MSADKQSELRLAMAQAVGMGLLIVLSSLMAEHAKLIGGDPDQATIRVRQIVDHSLSQLSAKGTTDTGEKGDAGPEIRRRIAVMLDTAEQQVRQLLGLPPGSKSSH